jgi:hypothetical protein
MTSRFVPTVDIDRTTVGVEHPVRDDGRLLLVSRHDAPTVVDALGCADDVDDIWDALCRTYPVERVGP